MTDDVRLISEFRAYWERYHPGCLPLGWALRQVAGAPWVRFHALPGSKRYADVPVERRTILSRANSLGDWLLGPAQFCFVVEAQVGSNVGLGGFAMTAAESDDPDYPIWSFYVRRERWRAGAYDDKLLSIAEDEPGRAIWVRGDNGAVFAPDDGGFDLFATTWQAVADLKTEWPDWLSSHPAGL
jgi:hypothetical protein